MGDLTNKVVLVSQQPGFCFWVFLSFVWVGYMLKHDHSLMGGSDDVWLGGVVGLFERPLSFCIVLCPCPLDMGNFFIYFAPCFAYPM